MTIIALVSGGLDSVTLAYRLRAETPEDLIFVSFDYGQKHLKEIDYARCAALSLQAEHRVIALPPLHGSSLTDEDHEVPDGHYNDPVMRETVVPNRNMVMIAHAIGVAVTEEATRLAVAVHAGDAMIYPDCRPAFIAAMTTAALVANEGFIYRAFRIVTPFITQSKQWIVAEGNRLHVPYRATWSCYKGGDFHCGRCGTCVERLEAFHRSGVSDPTYYAAGALNL